MIWQGNIPGKDDMNQIARADYFRNFKNDENIAWTEIIEKMTEQDIVKELRHSGVFGPDNIRNSKQMVTNQNRLDKSMGRTRIRGNNIQQSQSIGIKHIRATNGEIHRTVGNMQKNMAKSQRIRMQSQQTVEEMTATKTLNIYTFNGKHQQNQIYQQCQRHHLRTIVYNVTKH